MASIYKGRILLISYGGAHVNAIIPLYKELVHRGYECIYLALTTAKKVAEHYELRPISLSALLNMLLYIIGNTARFWRASIIRLVRVF